MRFFIGFGQVPYIGIPQPKPIKLGQISGACIPLLFLWAGYGASTSKPNINVLVDLNNALCKSFDQIRSVYIDNLGSDNPVYVNFPDTGYVIAAAPNSEGWYPAFTNAKTIWVIGEGFLTGDIPVTNILLCNIPLTPAVNVEINQAVALWRASPVITRGSSIYNSSFGIPALGDQLQSSNVLNMTVANSFVPLWGTPYSSGFLYLTSFLAYVTNVVTSISQNFAFVIESTGVAGTLFAPVITVYQNSGGGIPITPFNQNILQLSGMQVKLDATQTWRMRLLGGASVGPSAAGSCQAISTFTQQP